MRRARTERAGVLALTLAFAVALVMGDAEVKAQQAEANPMEVARGHMERGQALYQAGRFIESAEEFLRAYEAQPFAAFLFNAGVAYEKLDDPGRAADYFGRYLEADPQADARPEIEQRIEKLRGLSRARETQLAAETAAQQAADGTDEAASAAALAELEAARKRLTELETQLASLRGTGANFKSLLSVQTKPEDATITLKDAKGKLVNKGTGSPFSQTLDEGRYYVEVQHPKYKTISTPINISAGKVYVIITEMSQGQFLGFLRVTSNVPGAKVYVDKREEGHLGQTPFQNPLATGAHHVWIEKPGYQVVERDVEIGVGDDVELRVDLERVNYGRVRVVANKPDAEVFIDGKPMGKVPVERDVSGGTHEILVRSKNMKDWEETVTVSNGQVTPVRVRLRPAVGRAGAWATAGVAAGFLGLGIATGVIGSQLEDELTKTRDAGLLSEGDPRLLRGKILYITSDVSYGLTALFAGLATYYFLRDPLPDSEGRALEPRDWTFNPYVGPERTGGHVRVRF
jgi:hypothetical protein